MVADILSRTAGVSFLPYKGATETDGKPTRLPPGALSGHNDLHAGQSAPSNNSSATKVTLSAEALAIFQKPDAITIEISGAEEIGGISELPWGESQNFELKLENNVGVEQLSRLAGQYLNLSDGVGIGDVESDLKQKSELINLEFKILRASMPIREDSELVKINSEIELREGARERLPKTKAFYEKILNTEPVPVKVLNREEKAAALKLAHSLGHSPWGESYSFSHGDTAYTFLQDGTVTTNEVNVPKSAEEKASMLKYFKERIAYATTPPVLIARRDVLEAKLASANAERVTQNNAYIARRDEILSGIQAQQE